MKQVLTEMKKGPCSSDEDSKLIHSISIFGQGRWNSLAHRINLGEVITMSKLLENQSAKACKRASLRNQ
uniref:Uncharacterized protein n=1 Tax=Solanum lycopersicum TaxID=4081 RepID=A0A3Q7GS53_SOLLC